MFFKAKSWSPVEISFLKDNKDKLSINQLTIALARSRSAIQNKIDELNGKPQKKASKKRTKIGKRTDLKHFFRSAWEANFARYFNHTGWKWKYEPTVYSFLEFGVKKGTVTYCPDFEIVSPNGEHLLLEIKGMLNQKSKTATRRFKKFYPNEFARLVAIVGRKGTKADEFYKGLGIPIIFYYADIDKQYKNIIHNWE